MTIDSSCIPQVEEGGSMGIAGANSGVVYDAIPKYRLDQMEPWSFQESLQARDRRLGSIGVTEDLTLVPLPADATRAMLRLLEEFDGGRNY